MKQLILLVFSLMLLACQQSNDSTGSAVNSADEALIEATAATHADDVPDATPITEVAPATALLEQELAYGAANDRNFVGYFVLPEDVIEPLPAVILIHEWWGLNDNIRAMARRLAGEGYAVLAVDLYGGSTATTAEEAEELMTTVMAEREQTLANIRQAYEYLEQFALAPRIGTLGWCLGGGWSLQAGLALADDLDALVMYYGQVVLDEGQLDQLNAPLLGLFAELDEAILLQDVQAFRSRLQDLGKPAEVLIYPGVAHAFANPSGGAYDAEAAEDAWGKTLEFLNSNLKIDD